MHFRCFHSWELLAAKNIYQPSHCVWPQTPSGLAAVASLLWCLRCYNLSFYISTATTPLLYTWCICLVLLSRPGEALKGAGAYTGLTACMQTSQILSYCYEIIRNNNIWSYEINAGKYFCWEERSWRIGLQANSSQFCQCVGSIVGANHQLSFFPILTDLHLYASDEQFGQIQPKLHEATGLCGSGGRDGIEELCQPWSRSPVLMKHFLYDIQWSTLRMRGGHMSPITRVTCKKEKKYPKKGWWYAVTLQYPIYKCYISSQCLRLR